MGRRVRILDSRFRGNDRVWGAEGLRPSAFFSTSKSGGQRVEDGVHHDGRRAWQTKTRMVMSLDNEERCV